MTGFGRLRCNRRGVSSHFSSIFNKPTTFTLASIKVSTMSTASRLNVDDRITAALGIGKSCRPNERNPNAPSEMDVRHPYAAIQTKNKDLMAAMTKMVVRLHRLNHRSSYCLHRGHWTPSTMVLIVR